MIDQQIAACTRVLGDKAETKKNKTYAYNNRGSVWDDKGEYDKVIADFDQAISLDPKYAYAYNNRGNAWNSKGDYDKAIADFDKAISLDPKYAYAYNNRGSVWDDKGKYDKAIADFDQAISLDPKYAYAYNNRGNAWNDKGEYDKAIADYDQAISLDPKYAYAYRARGILLLYSGNVAKAQSDFQQAVANAPSDAYHAIWLAIAKRANNLSVDLAEPEKKLDMAKWPAPVVRLWAGQLTTDAVFAAAKDPDSHKEKGQICEANFYVGALHQANGNSAEASKLFREAVDGCPKDYT